MTNITYHELIDELTYRSYRWQRIRTPDIPPENWALIFPNVPEMETRFEEELADKAADTNPKP